MNSEIPERELRETEDIYTAREPIRSQPTRTPTDFAEVREAARILASNLETQHLSSRLLQEHNLPGLIAIPGSHFVHAANVALSGKLTHGQRKAWPYFTKIASNYQPGQDAPTQADKPQVPYYREFIARMKARAQAEAEAEAKECSCESTTGSGIGSTGTSPGTSGSGPETPVPSRPPASSTPGGLLS